MIKIYKKIKNWLLLKWLKRKQKQLDQKVNQLFKQKRIPDGLKERKALLRVNKEIKNLSKKG